MKLLEEKKFNALVIGAGKIGSEFDSINDINILTHAHAYIKHNNFNLLGFYDINSEKAKIASEKWNCKYFKNISDIAEKIDVISICTPDCIHLESIKLIENLSPKLIFLEKPIANNLKHIESILDVSKKMPIAVNYSRRFSKEFQVIAEKIKKNKFGSFLNGCGYYGKGFIHNGSHMIDILRLLIGEIKFIEKISEINDFYEDDPSKNANVFFDKNIKFLMTAVDCKYVSIFELDLFFEKARIKIIDSGLKIEIYKINDDKFFDGYKKFERTEEILTDLNISMLNAVNNISLFLSGKEELLCDIKDGYEAIKYA